MRLLAGAMRQGIQAASQSSPLMLPEGLQEAGCPANLFLTSDLQKCEKIHLCCFKALSVW